MEDKKSPLIEKYKKEHPENWEHAVRLGRTEELKLTNAILFGFLEGQKKALEILKG